MLSNETQNWLSIVFQWAALIFVVVIGLAVMAVMAIYIIDKFQTKHAVKRNYPVIGRFRYWFEHLGEFFRQYFFAMDRERFCRYSDGIPRYKRLNHAGAAWIQFPNRQREHAICLRYGRRCVKLGFQTIIALVSPVRSQSQRR